jgi:hypothetical protein
VDNDTSTTTGSCQFSYKVKLSSNVENVINTVMSRSQCIKQMLIHGDQLTGDISSEAPMIPPKGLAQ